MERFCCKVRSGPHLWDVNLKRIQV